MKKAVIAYLLAVMLISLIGLSVGITVADNPESGDGGTHSQDDDLHTNPDPQLLGLTIRCVNMVNANAQD